MIRVTELLRGYGFYGSYEVPQYYLDRGSMIHQTIEYYNKGTLDNDTLDESLKPYLSSYIEFINSVDFDILGYEQRITNKIYTGQIDLICMINKHRAIIDIKTGWTELPAYQIQTALYAMLMNNKVKRYCLFIDKDKYKLIEHADIQDYAVARSLLNLYQFQKAKNILPPSFIRTQGDTATVSPDLKEVGKQEEK